MAAWFVRLFIFVLFIVDGRVYAKQKICMEVDSVEPLPTGVGAWMNYSLSNENNDELMLIINEKISNAVGQLRTDIEKKMIDLEKRIFSNQLKTSANITAIFAESFFELKNEVMPLVGLGKGYCHVRYENWCFWIELHAQGDITIAEARTICRERGGHLANVYNQDHYNRLMKEIRSRMPSNSEHVYVWIGMRFNPLTGDVLYGNGDIATYANWIAGEFPKLGKEFAKRIDIDIKVYLDENVPGSGMGNYDGSDGGVSHGVFCQI